MTVGSATIYCGDALSILPEIEAADVLVTDPPYRLTSGGNTDSGFMKAGAFARDAYNNDGGIVRVTCEFAEWLPVAVAALKADADLYMMANDKNLGALLSAVDAAGLGLHVNAGDKMHRYAGVKLHQ